MVGMISQSRLFGRWLRVLTRLETREPCVSEPCQVLVVWGFRLGMAGMIHLRCLLSARSLGMR